MPQLHDLTAIEQAEAVRRREVSPVELAEHYLERISRLDEPLGGYATVAVDAVREAAKDAERRVLSVDDVYVLPAMLGVPTAVMDVVDVAGVPTKLGSRACLDAAVPLEDDLVVTRIRDGGMTVLGKTNVPELGFSCYTEGEVTAAARNPYDTARGAGGSAGGSAVAVAAGTAPVAHGADVNGSVRTPASLCGLVGLKTSRGRVTPGRCGFDLFGMSTHGVLARTVADAAGMLDILAGYLPGDPYSAPALPRGDRFVDHAVSRPHRLRVARWQDNPLGVPVHPACVAAWESTSALLAQLGHEVIDLPPVDIPMLLEMYRVMWCSMCAAVPIPSEREHLLLPLTRMLREEGRSYRAVDVMETAAQLRTACRRIMEHTSRYDAVLMPTLAQPPPLVGQLRDDDDPDSDFSAQVAFAPYSFLANLTGQPAITVPLYWTGEGLPIGVQFLGRYGDEAGLIRLTAELEVASPWSWRHPSLW